MGTPLPPNEPGLLCPLCWGPAKLFGDGPSPLVIQVRLTRFLPGDSFEDPQEQLLLQTHWLEQLAGPCSWRIDDGIFVWFAEFTSFETVVDVRRKLDNKPAFVGAFTDVCATDLPNTLLQPIGNVAFGGFANINWDLEGLS